jgi:DNA repair exonuclease SbcCD ATPase subunit
METKTIDLQGIRDSARPSGACTLRDAGTPPSSPVRDIDLDTPTRDALAESATASILQDKPGVSEIRMMVEEEVETVEALHALQTRCVNKINALKSKLGRELEEQMDRYRTDAYRRIEQRQCKLDEERSRLNEEQRRVEEEGRRLAQEQRKVNEAREAVESDMAAVLTNTSSSSLCRL